MFRRATKVQFNAQKYALLTEKSGHFQSQISGPPVRNIMGSVLLVLLGFSAARKFQTRHIINRNDINMLPDGSVMPANRIPEVRARLRQGSSLQPYKPPGQ